MFTRMLTGWSPSTPTAAVGEAVIIHPFGPGAGCGDCIFAPPAITAQPTNQATSCGATATFSVAAVGTSPLAYQWYFGATPLAGETSNSMVISNVDYPVTGPYQVVVTNSCGSVTSYLAWLSISDPVPPSVSSWPTNQTIAANASCQAQVPDLTSQVSASDNCGAVTIWQQPEAGTWVGLGQTLVTVSVYDQAGNVTNNSPTLTVSDLTPPTIVACATNRTLVAGPTCTTNLPDLRPEIIASDNCSSVTVTQSPPPGSVLGLGQTLVTFSARDAAGNSNGCATIVTVVDRTPPTITCSTNITTVCTSTNGAPVFFAPSTADNCDPSPVITSVPPSGSIFAKGTTVVACTATDFSGNTNFCSFTVTVLDPILPLLRIALEGTNAAIYWPQACTCYVLEETGNLTLRQWSTSPAVVEVAGTNYCVRVTPAAQSKYFRLRELSP